MTPDRTHTGHTRREAAVYAACVLLAVLVSYAAPWGFALAA